MRKDLRLTRICVASIRFFYPHIRIDLIKDESNRRFCTREIQQTWNVGIETFGRDRAGGGGMLIKLEPLFMAAGERVLLLDNDTVFAGPVLDAIDQTDADFVVTEDRTQGDLTSAYGQSIVSLYLYDLSRLREICPDFHFPARMFNAGHTVFSTGKFSMELLSQFIRRGPPATFRHDRLFQMGDQGFLNFLFEWQHQQENVSLQYYRFAEYPAALAGSLTAGDLAAGNSPPLIVHWAGCHNKSGLSRMLLADVLLFFESVYYKPLGFRGKCLGPWRAFCFFLRYHVAEKTRGLRKVLRRLQGKN
jgi:hypothetical protein